MRTLPLLCALLALPLHACSDDSGPPPDTRADADARAAIDLVVADRSASDDISPDGGADSAPFVDAGADVGRADVASGLCAPIGANECFSNDDCRSERRCEEVDVGGGELAACCVVGARGTLTAGESCTDQNECASAVCIAVGSTMGDGRCSKTCTDASECPLGMQDCKFIAFSGSDFRWCFPEVR